jgi:sorbitol/mannitol transport system substrate-binding protein
MLKPVLADKRIIFATSERRPYIGQKLPNQGYVSELMREVSQRIGYEVQIDYYPLVRALRLLEQGRVDGYLPSHYESAFEDHSVFSEPFPGDTVGLLKRKSLQAKYVTDPVKHPEVAFAGLKNFTFGAVRGSRVTPIFDKILSGNTEYVGEDLRNLDKLNAGRVDLVVIDKNTAAEFLVTERPHYIGQLQFMKPPIAAKPFHIAFSKKKKGYEQVKKDFDRGLQEVTQDGTLDRILRKHGLFLSEEGEAGKNKLTIGTVNNRDMIIMQELSKEFEKANPAIQLEWRVMDENTLRLRLLSDLSIADGQFDIMTIGASEAPIWAEKGRIAAIRDLPVSYDVEDILHTVRDSLSYQGQLYALPFYAESSMIYYRTDLFEKAGLSMPENPTYADIEKFAAAIHDPENEIYGIGLRGKPGWGENMCYLGTLINTFGGQWFDKHWNPTINSPEWKNALTYYINLMGKYGPPNATLNGFQENLSLFSNGHSGMWIDATVAAGFLFDPEKSQVHDKVGFAAAPIGVTARGSHWMWSWALAIPESSNNKEAAQQFIVWATSKEYIQLVAQRNSWLAVPPGTRKSTYENENYRAAAPFASFVLNAIQTADPILSTLKPKPYVGIQFVAIPEFSAIGDLVGLKISEVLKGSISLDVALHDAQRFAVRQMQNSEYIK